MRIKMRIPKNQFWMNPRAIVVFATAAWVVGCSSVQLKLDRTPKDAAEFVKPPEQLIAAYPDIAGYHLPDGEAYLDAAKKTHDKSRAFLPTVEDLLKTLGPPDQEQTAGISKIRVATHPGFGFALISAPYDPKLSAIFLGITVPSLFLKSDRELTWEKGNYRVVAKTFLTDRNLEYWDWYYKPEGQTEWQSVVAYRQSRGYSLWNVGVNHAFGPPGAYGEPNYIELGRGWSFGQNAVTTRLELSTSIQSWREKGFYILDVSKQAATAITSRKILDGKNEIGVGLAYDTSLVSLADNGYLGKVGAFVEYMFLDTRRAQFALRLGLAHDISGRDYGANILKLQLVTKFYKFERQ